jgi:hypothetical protein
VHAPTMPLPVTSKMAVLANEPDHLANLFDFTPKYRLNSQ